MRFSRCSEVGLGLSAAVWVLANSPNAQNWDVRRARSYQVLQMLTTCARYRKCIEKQDNEQLQKIRENAFCVSLMQNLNFYLNKTENPFSLQDDKKSDIIDKILLNP